MKSWQANLIFISIALFWGIGFPMTKEGASFLEPMTFMSVRFVIALALIILIRPTALAKCNRVEWLAGSGLGVCLGLGYIVQTIGLTMTTSGKTGFLTSLNIVLVPILGALFLSRKVMTKEKIGVALAVIGFGFLSLRPNDLGFKEGDLWVLACAFFYALQILGIDKYVRQVNPYRLNLTQIIVATIICSIGAFVFEDFRWYEAGFVWWPIIFTAVFATAYPFISQVYAQRVATPSTAALLLSLEAIFATFFGWLLDGELLSGQEYLGCCLVFIASLFVLFPNPQRRTPLIDAVGKRSVG